MNQPFERHDRITIDDVSPVEHLARTTGLARHRVKHAMQCGAVWLTRGDIVQRLRRATKSLKAGDTVHIYYSDQVLDATIEPPELIADEDAYSVWYKPFGVRSQGSKWGDHCTLYRWAKRHLKPQRPAFTVHRLDMAATGLMLVAHRKKTAAQLSELFRGRRIEKHYRAVVTGHMASSNPIEIDSPIDGREARSLVTVFDAQNSLTLLDVRIETGRKHQIRRHLAELGYPVVGDRQYGSDNSRNLQLTASSLSFTCPVTGETKHYELPQKRLPSL